MNLHLPSLAEEDLCGQCHRSEALCTPVTLNSICLFQRSVYMVMQPEYHQSRCGQRYFKVFSSGQEISLRMQAHVAWSELLYGIVRLLRYVAAGVVVVSFHICVSAKCTTTLWQAEEVAENLPQAPILAQRSVSRTIAAKHW